MTRIDFRKTQTGAVLFMAMIFLVLITVMAVTMFTVSRNTAQVVNNINLRKLSLQAANQTSDVAMSTYKIVSSPAAVLPNGTDIMDVDVNGDGKTVINTEVKPPSCNKGQPKENLNLDLNDPVPVSYTHLTLPTKA